MTDDKRKELIEKYGNKSDDELNYLEQFGKPKCNASLRKFKSFEEGYRFCSRWCECAKEEQSKKIKNKWSNKSENQIKEIFDKVKKTNLEKYGFTNPALNEDVKQKTRKTNLERYNSEISLQSEIIKDKIKNTNLEKYGVEYPLQSKDIRNKGIETYIENHNEYPSMKEARKVFLDKNNKNPFQVEEIQEKIKETMIKKYGTEKALCSPIILERMRLKELEKYNFNNVSQRHYSTETFEILESKDKFKEFIETRSFRQASKELKINETTLMRRYDKYGLRSKLDIGRSSYEKEIKHFLDENNIKFTANSKKYTYPFEIDFILDDYNLGIEFNGLYWHSEHKKPDKNYHKNKWESCKEHDIQLISIFENEWNTKKELIKNKILNLCGKSEKGVGARKLNIKIIDFKQGFNFINQYHIQGCNHDIIHMIGAFDKDELVGVCAFSKNKKNETDLKRFCSNGKIYSGLFSKLLKFYIRNFNPEKIITFADLRYSNGNLYEKTGFIISEILPPTYYYTDYQNVYHKFNFRKEKIKKKFKVDITNKTERELMQDLGYDRIWDCGKIKFELIIDKIE